MNFEKYKESLCFYPLYSNKGTPSQGNNVISMVTQGVVIAKRDNVMITRDNVTITRDNVTITRDNVMVTRGSDVTCLTF